MNATLQEKLKKVWDIIRPTSNLQTGIWGYVTLFAGVIAMQPDLIDFLPDKIESYVKGFSTLIAVATGSLFVSSLKNKDVTGGSIPATDEAKSRLVKESLKNNL